MTGISTAIIAYWGDTNDIEYIEYIEYIEGDLDYGPERIFDAMQRFVCDGHVTEVLDVIHALDAIDQAEERCDIWRNQLRKRGYETE